MDKIFILKNHSLSQSISTKFHHLDITKLSGIRNNMRAVSMEAYWVDSNTEAKPVIKIYLSNDKQTKALANTLSLGAENSQDDSEIFLIASKAKYLQIEVEGVPESTGILNITLYYR